MAIYPIVAFLESIKSWWRARKMMRAMRDVMERPDDPSPRYIRRQVRRLLHPMTATIACRELKRIGRPAMPFLAEVLPDPRYRQAEWYHPTVSPPLQSLFELLLPLAPDTVIDAAIPVIDSPSAAARRIAANFVAGAGRAQTLPTLVRLLGHADADVRGAVLMGMCQAVREGVAEHGFDRAAYDLALVACGDFRGDGVVGGVSALYDLDAARAAVNVPWARLLRPETPQIVELLGIANDDGLRLPEQSLRDLIEHATPLATGERMYPNEYIAARALTALATAAGERVRPVAEQLSTHSSKLIREAAARVLGQLKGVADPVGFVLDRARDAGFHIMHWPQQAVYLAFGFEALVQGDGLIGYFSASSPRVAETLRALREIGDMQGEQTLARAAEMVGPAAYEDDEDRRTAALNRRWDELQDAFGPIERAYYDAAVSTSEHIARYATVHAAYFREG